MPLKNRQHRAPRYGAGLGTAVPAAGVPRDRPVSRRMSMRSPVSPALELDGAGSMVNCTIKTEEKRESGYESAPGAAPSTEPRPNDPPGPPPREGTAPPPLPQVGPTAVTQTLVPGKGGRLFPRVVVPHPKETKLKRVVPSRLFWLLLMLSGQPWDLRALPSAWSPPDHLQTRSIPQPPFSIALGFSGSSLSPPAPCAASRWGRGPASWAI